MHPGDSRRKFLSRAASGGVALARFGSGVGGAASPDAGDGRLVTAREYLQGILYTRDEVRRWLADEAFPFAKYSAEYGWLLRNGRFRDGINGSTSVYTYGPLDERITVNYRDRPCRINTYGDSFTQCHQVSDGETWQELLAAHLQEPVRNFGVGGWSVYQAYLRMLHEERRAPADVIIFNIYDDDHFRSLDSWRNIRVHKHPAFIEPTLPHVVVNVKEQTFEERPNPCPTPDSVFGLCDLEWVLEKFQADFTLQIMLAHRNAGGDNQERAYADVMKLATTHGIVTRAEMAERLSRVAETVHREAAHYASERIVQKIEAFARTHGKKLLFVLSYSAKPVARAVKEGVREDQAFIDFLKRREAPVVDLLQAHVDDYAQCKGTIEDYVAKHWIGHYTPRGNLFCAQAIMPRLLELLQPGPAAYRP